jgi:hypothetical protein
MLSEISRTYHYLNPEINEAIEKLYLNLNLTSNEQQKKGVIELHKFFLERLSKNLEKRNALEITDLILDKSLKISEITKEYDWSPAETLKVSNLVKNTNLFYTYIRARLNMLTGKGIRTMKDGANKAIDALVKILQGVIDENIKLENNLIYICFEDLLSFYVLSRFNEQSKELIEDLISLYQEESNIEGLAKMDKIAETAEGNLFKGGLVTLFQFKLDLITQNKDMNLSILENVFKHQNILRNKCFLLNAELIWAYSCYKFIISNKNESDYDLCRKCFEVFDIAKNYKLFLLTNRSNFIALINKCIEKLRSLIIILFVNNKIHLSNSLFLRLDYEPNQIIDLKNTSNYYCSQVLKLIKDNNIRDYQLLNFLNLISKKLSGDNKADNLIETQKKFNDLIIKKEEELKTEDIKNKEEYLNMRLTEKNKKFKDLLKL